MQTNMTMNRTSTAYAYSSLRKPVAHESTLKKAPCIKLALSFKYLIIVFVISIFSEVGFCQNFTFSVKVNPSNAPGFSLVDSSEAQENHYQITNNAWAGWTVSPGEPTLIPVLVDGIAIMIPQYSSVVVANSKNGAIFFEKDTYTTFLLGPAPIFRNLQPTNPLHLELQPTNPSYRPTLLVTIPGTTTSRWWGPYGDTWEAKAIAKLHNELTRYGCEVYSMMIDWDTETSNTSQVKQVANFIKNNFLATKINDWDVVIIGHSRGGIFAHELSKYLKDEFVCRRIQCGGRVYHLMSILLDPTAATGWGDFFPSVIPVGVNKGMQYDDGKPFVPFNVTMQATIDERDILGYEHQEMQVSRCAAVALNDSCSHREFAFAYTESQHFTDDIAFLKSSKGVRGSFPKDITVSPEQSVSVLTISAPVEHHLGNIGGHVENDTFYGYINSNLLGLPIPLINAEIIAGVDGLGVGVATTVAAANIIMSAEGVAASSSVGNAQVSVSIDAENIVQVAGSIAGVVGGEISLTNGGSISISHTKIRW
jgi:hypothetical protein